MAERAKRFRIDLPPSGSSQDIVPITLACTGISGAIPVLSAPTSGIGAHISNPHGSAFSAHGSAASTQQDPAHGKPSRCLCRLPPELLRSVLIFLHPQEVFGTVLRVKKCIREIFFASGYQARPLHLTRPSELSLLRDTLSLIHI